MKKNVLLTLSLFLILTALAFAQPMGAGPYYGYQENVPNLTPEQQDKLTKIEQDYV